MVMLASASAITICCGVLCLTDADLAWQFYEWDCRMMNERPLQLRDRYTRIKQAGYGLIVLGVVGLMVSMGV